jgi:hypothetical protein
MTAIDIIRFCEKEWPANKANCSGFVKAVAADLGLQLTGLADDIVDQITDPSWTALADGVEAKAKADAGWFVIGGLKVGDQQQPEIHGHVVVVVAGPLAHGLYPTGYWGRLNGVGEKNKTINFAWNQSDRDKVKYAARKV